MERLTAYDSDDFAYVKGGKVMDKKVSAAILRLAAYENTGLTPEEVKAALRELERYRGLGTAEELNEAAYNASL